jgi:hypothetical protein
LVVNIFVQRRTKHDQFDRRLINKRRMVDT